MPYMWRWEQGRLLYFSLSKIRKISEALLRLEGIDLHASNDPMREVMPAIVGLPFAPDRYKVWRNYARVFKILGLASCIDNILVPTELCKRLPGYAQDPITYDEYFQYIVRTFYYPSPAFERYDARSPQIFAFCAILKLLVSKAQAGKPFVSVREVFDLLIGNGVTGLEPIGYYQNLPSTGLEGEGSQPRQVREMMIFMSQLSYLAWLKGNLYIDLSALSNLDIGERELLMTPIKYRRKTDSDAEVQNIFGLEQFHQTIAELRESVNTDDVLFVEGKKVRSIHLRTERNREVVRYFFKNAENPYLCDVCEARVADRYPWVKNLIEVHHVLPLSSPLNIDKAGTSINDLVGLCPNCHRATHVFYKTVLKQERLVDFKSEQHAREVYSQVKHNFVSNGNQHS